MRFIIMHKTNAHWEAGALPDEDLVARVGSLLGGLAQAGALIAGEGLRPSSEGVRLRFSAGERTILPGPFEPGNELPAGFNILRTASLEESIEWATRQAARLGDVEIDIRPVTEPWDIGMAPRPADLTTRRYMVLRKATDSSEAGAASSRAAQPELSRLIDETTRAGVHLAAETMAPSRRGRQPRSSSAATSSSGRSRWTLPLGGQPSTSGLSVRRKWTSGNWSETLATQRGSFRMASHLGELRPNPLDG